MVTNIVTKLAKNPYSPRLKVAAEALSVLTKTSNYTFLILISFFFFFDLMNFERRNRQKTGVDIWVYN